MLCKCNGANSKNRSVARCYRIEARNRFNAAGTTVGMIDSAAQQRFLDSLAARPEYSWNVTQPQMSLMQRLRAWFFEMLRSIFPDISPEAGYTIIIFVLVALFVLVVLIVMRLRGGRYQRIRRRPQVVALDSESELLLDNEQLAQRAVAEGRWRDAVRHMYLVFLRDLRDANLIDWRAEKTNRDYVREVSTSSFAEAFKGLVYDFERSWYGADETTSNDFERVSLNITSLRRQVSQMLNRK